jgi:hypothetical protein
MLLFLYYGNHHYPVSKLSHHHCAELYETVSTVCMVKKAVLQRQQ